MGRVHQPPSRITMLKFSKANTKLKQLHDVEELKYWLENKRKVYSLDLLSGYSCPAAKDCLSKVVQIDGKRKIKDGKDCKFRCFSASQEVVFPAVYDNRKHNFDMLRNDDEFGMTCSIQDAMPKNLGICRIHVAGDFFNQSYFNAWANVARNNPDRLFYAYTKSLRYWVLGKVGDSFLGQRIDRPNLPQNLVLTASRGGRLDHLIDEHQLREAKVVFSEAEADELGYTIDHDDSHAAIPSQRDNSFALLIHGQQPKGSEASQALKQLKSEKVKFSYGKTGTPLSGV